MHRRSLKRSPIAPLPVALILSVVLTWSGCVSGRRVGPPTSSGPQVSVDILGASRGGAAGPMANRNRIYERKPHPVAPKQSPPPGSDPAS